MIRPPRLRRAGVRDVSVSMAGSIVGQLALVLVVPYLTRRFSPADLGALAVFLSITGLVYVVAGGRYESAVPVPADDADAVAVLQVSLLCVAASALLATAGWWLLGEPISDALGVPAIAGYAWLVGLTVVSAGAQQSLSVWFVRQGRFTSLGRSRAVQGVAAASLQALAASRDADLTLLLAAPAVGWLAATAVLYDRAAVRPCGRGPLRVAARRHRRFPLLAGPSSLLNRFALEAPAILVAAMFGASAAGAFLLAYRVVLSPASLVIQACYQVFVHRAAPLIRAGSREVLSLHRRAIVGLAGVSALPCAVVVVAGPALFGAVFGSDWEVSGELARYLAVAAVLHVPAGTVGATFSLVERPQMELLREASRTGLVLASFAIVELTDASLEQAVALYSGAMLLGHLLLISWSRRELEERLAVAQP